PGDNTSRQIATVEKMFGVKVNGYILVDFNDIREFVPIIKQEFGINSYLDIVKHFINPDPYRKSTTFKDLNPIEATLWAFRLRKAKGLDANRRSDNNARFIAFLLKQGAQLYKNDRDKAISLISQVIDECDVDLSEEEVIELIDKVGSRIVNNTKCFDNVAGQSEWGTTRSGKRIYYFALQEPPSDSQLTLYEHIIGEELIARQEMERRRDIYDYTAALDDNVNFTEEVDPIGDLEEFWQTVNGEVNRYAKSFQQHEETNVLNRTYKSRLSDHVILI
ncbi:unnamed protein product, partial [marine sediment metagenome]